MPTAAVHSALSLSGKVQEYGGWAGFAAVVGLGVLSLLYFAQAREVKRLREWAGRAPERDAELQQRVAADAQVRAATPAAQTATGPQTPAGASVAPGAVAATAAAARPAQPGAAPATPLAAPAAATAAAARPGQPAVPAAATAAAATAVPGAAKPATPQA